MQPPGYGVDSSTWRLNFEGGCSECGVPAFVCLKWAGYNIEMSKHQPPRTGPAWPS
jgi:hypothetical protein